MLVLGQANGVLLMALRGYQVGSSRTRKKGSIGVFSPFLGVFISKG